MSPAKRRLPLLLAGLALFALALGARLPHLATESLWEDDWLNLDRVTMAPADMAHIQKWLGPSRTTYDFHPPLYYALEHAILAAPLPLSATMAAKLPGVLAGSLTVVLVFFLGRALFSTQAGLAGAILCAASLYHVSTSRAIKVYALLLLLFCASLLALVAALRRGRPGPWLGYAALAGLALYSAYVAVPAVAGQGLFAAASLGWAWLRCREERPGLRRHMLWAGLAFALVGLCYLPWLPGLLFIQETFFNPDVHALERLTWPFLREVLADFTRFAAPSPGPWPYLVLGAALLGCVAAMWQRKALSLLAILAPSLLPVAALVAAKSEMNQILATRHLVTLFPALILLAGQGLASLGALARKPAWAGTALAGILALGLAFPEIRDLPRLWRHTISYDKELAAFLEQERTNAPGLEFAGYKAAIKRFAAGFYLDGLYRPLSEDGVAGYGRAVLVQNGLPGDPLLSWPGAAPLTDFTVSIFHTRADKLGLVNAAPLAVLPGPDGTYVFADDYKDGRVHTEAADLQNLAVDPALSLLAPIGIRPGRVDYAFVAPEGVTVKAAELAVSLRLYKRNRRHVAPCFAEIQASRDGGPFATLARLTQADFENIPEGSCPSLLEIPIYNTCRSLTRSLDVGSLAAGAKTFTLRLVLDPGREEGYLHLDGVKLTATTEGRAAPLAAARLALANLAAKGALLSGDPETPHLASQGVYALAATTEATTLPGVAGGPNVLARYRAAHPGEAPVAELPGDHGAPAVLLFDPVLADPYIRLSAQKPGLEVEAAGETFPALTVTGALDAPSVVLGEKETNVPVAAPAGTTLAVNASGPGRLWWNPDFSRDRFAAMTPADPGDAVNIRPAPDADHDGGLTCREAAPCRADFAFVSGWPMTRALLTAFPRVQNDAQRQNAARVLFSTDGANFQVLEELRSDGSGTWTELFTPHRLEIPLSRPTGRLYLRLEMTGDGAQFWSHTRPIDRMGLALALDTRTFAPIAAPTGRTELRLSRPGRNDVGLLFGQTPIPFPREVETP